MNTLRVALISLGMLAASTATAQDRLQVLDQGLDGNQRTYVITCPTGKLASVVQHFDLDIEASEQISGDAALTLTAGRNVRPPKLAKVCVFPHSGRERCRDRWPLDRAAAASCR